MSFFSLHLRHFCSFCAIFNDVFGDIQPLVRMSVTRSDSESPDHDDGTAVLRTPGLDFKQQVLDLQQH